MGQYVDQCSTLKIHHEAKAFPRRPIVNFYHPRSGIVRQTLVPHEMAQDSASIVPPINGAHDPYRSALDREISEPRLRRAVPGRRDDPASRAFADLLRPDDPDVVSQGHRRYSNARERPGERIRVHVPEVVLT